MPRPNRQYDKPHYDLTRVHDTAAKRDIVVTGRASAEATRVFPPDLIDIDGEIREIIASLTPAEYEFTDKRTNKVGLKTFHSIVDVYRIDFEGVDIWIKIKIEQDCDGDFVVVISFHEWDDSRPV